MLLIDTFEEFPQKNVGVLRNGLNTNSAGNSFGIFILQVPQPFNVQYGNALNTNSAENLFGIFILQVPQPFIVKYENGLNSNSAGNLFGIFILQVLQHHFLTLCWNLTVYGSAFFRGYIKEKVGSLYRFHLSRCRPNHSVADGYFGQYKMIQKSKKID